MVDQDFNCWLLEVNSSPAMDYSTEVTKRLVKMVLEDTIKVVCLLKLIDFYEHFCIWIGIVLNFPLFHLTFRFIFGVFHLHSSNCCTAVIDVFVLVSCIVVVLLVNFITNKRLRHSVRLFLHR